MSKKETHDDKEELTDFQRTWRIKKSLAPLIEQHMEEMKQSAISFNNGCKSIISEYGDAAVLDHSRSMMTSSIQELNNGDYVLMIRSDNGDVLLKEMTTEKSPEEAAPVSVDTETCLENAKKTHSKLKERGIRAMEINKAESAEMVCLASNYFRLKWRGSRVSLEDLRIPFKEYITYVKERAALLDNYPDNWEQQLIQTLIWDAWVFTTHDGVIHAKPFSRGIKGWTSDMQVHPTVNQSEDLDLRRYAKKGF